MAKMCTIFKTYIYLNLFSDELQAGRTGFNSQMGQEIFLFSILSRPVLGPTQPSILWVPQALSPGLKRLGHEVSDSSASSTEMKNYGAIPPFSYMSVWHSA
jgi:hypothetical protein